MSTQLAEHAEHFVVSTIAAKGKERRLARRPVIVPKGDPEALKAAILAHCEAARKDFGIQQEEGGPVV